MTCADKSRFTSHEKARRAARTVSSDSGIQMRAYPCPDCGGWHLSSLILRTETPAAPKHRPKRGRRLAPGQSLEELAAQIRAERER